jgi:hypothetical protein
LQYLGELRAEANKRHDEIVASLQLQLGQIEDRLTRITDAYIDRLIEKDVFEQRKTALLAERLQVQESLAQWLDGTRSESDELQRLLERGDSAFYAYNLGNVPDKRDLVDTLTSNRLLNGKSLEVTLSSPFDLIASRVTKQDGSPRRDTPRTMPQLLKRLASVIHSSYSDLAQSATFPP